MSLSGSPCRAPGWRASRWRASSGKQWIASLALVLAACGEPEATAPQGASAERPSQGTSEQGTSEQGSAEEAPRPAASGDTPDTLPNGLLFAYSQFPVENGRAGAAPGPARLEILTRVRGEWQTTVVEDAESNVFHKALVLDPAEGEPGILTAGGMGAAVKLWRRQGDRWQAQTLWQTEFGGTRNRMRDVEVADLFGDGRPALAVATHDQGVVAVIRQQADGTWAVTELDREPNTFVHEIEIGDLNRDGTLEIYATPSEPNTLEGAEQRGQVVRYVPRANQGRTVVADLGNRHAKEIWVGDVDGDGRDELYVAVEALARGASIVEPVEIRRYDHDTPPTGGAVIARIPNERFLRFLTVGDVDGDGRREMIAAGFTQGLWLLRPGNDPRAEWTKESVARDSSGFEHAALLTDLDGDGRDELYVASDNEGELRRYAWVEGRVQREVLVSGRVPRSMMTFNIMPIPASMLR